MDVKAKLMGMKEHSAGKKIIGGSDGIKSSVVAATDSNYNLRLLPGGALGSRLRLVGNPLSVPFPSPAVPRTIPGDVYVTGIGRWV